MILKVEGKEGPENLLQNAALKVAIMRTSKPARKKPKTSRLVGLMVCFRGAQKALEAFVHGSRPSQGGKKSIGLVNKAL
ncbi:hypothetical protein J6590_015466 [Homalodisca vitripennis]|nr:hypothetical protein J6590_015466 [Homalodisca vitripennis]